MAASSRKTWKSVEEFLVSFGETTLYGKIQNSVPKAFTSTHRSTLLCSNFVKCCRREIDEIVHYLPDKKFRMPLQLSLLRGSCPKSTKANHQQYTQSAPDFIQIGSFSAEL